MRLLKMAKAWLLKVDASRLPAAMIADFWRKSLREFMRLIIGMINLGLFDADKKVFSIQIIGDIVT